LILNTIEIEPSVYHWAQVILKDKESAKYVSGIAFHWYQNSDKNIDQLDKKYKDFANYFLLPTEVCVWYAKDPHMKLGDWTTLECLNDRSHETIFYKNYSILNIIFTFCVTK
jgi:O-glycosyl hydrolase